MTIDRRDDPLRGYNFQVSLMDSSTSAINALTAMVSDSLLGQISSLDPAISTMTALNNVVVNSIQNKPAAGFNECSGLDMSLEIEDYMEGANNGTVLRFPTRVKWENITLKKGLTTNTELWDWFFGFVEGRGQRKDGLITLQNERHEPREVWGFRRGLPLKYGGPMLNAGQSEVAIESVEIVHEGLYKI